MKTLGETTRAAALALSAVFWTTSAARAEDCQAKLEAAILKITSSGPMRAFKKDTINGKPRLETVIEFVPPTDTRTVTKTLLQPEEQRQREEQFKKLPPELQKVQNADGTVAPMAFVGENFYMGTEKLPYADAERVKTPAHQLLDFSAFAWPRHYFSTACTATTIDFEYDIYADNVMARHAEDKSVSFATLNAERRTERARQDAEFGTKTSVLYGKLELDPASGRPLRILREEAVQSVPSTEMEQATEGKPDPDNGFRDVTSHAVDISFTYDPSIKIDAPK
jgi:hypothetical protein